MGFIGRLTDLFGRYSGKNSRPPQNFDLSDPKFFRQFTEEIAASQRELTPEQIRAQRISHAVDCAHTARDLTDLGQREQAGFDQYSHKRYK